eukprot:CAMPEP_0168527160 /NCGR_PEP_ID=MMETSP0405-20121227/12424_1 /TAXON_ID=498012 /ORGANISM="Trichosphaerium sp, Strain Am-I-7 wt" /LENGTH=323 /DNA_ID=CAMNT_0008550193 /DNA_START=19 /DNA_END=987 /DNA_ORIENTATION=-
MTAQTQDAFKDRFSVLQSETATAMLNFGDTVKVGLQKEQKKLSCAFFYDEEGSNLFEDICELEEYYVTRAETEILKTHSDEIAALFTDGTVVVELGSGSSYKTRLLLTAFIKCFSKLHYIPMDISDTMLRKSAHQLLNEYPTLSITAISAEYTEGLKLLKAQDLGPDATNRVYTWLGSSIGNFTLEDSITFLKHCRENMHPQDKFLIGFDLIKDTNKLVAAYDDKKGVTAAFNKNLLKRINAELGGNFDMDKFKHKSVWNGKKERIEMHLVSTEDQTVLCKNLDLEVDFKKGETIHTENSHKYSLESMSTIAKQCGFSMDKQW